MSKLMTHVKRKISHLLPHSFAIIFDEQTTPDAHYVAVIATFPTKDKNRFDSECLTLSLLEDETTQNGHEHVLFLSLILELFCESIENCFDFI